MSQSLAQLQTDFQAYILNPSQEGPFKKAIVDDEKVGADHRLGIYYDAYRLRLIEALSNIYPNLNALLGCNQFDQTARAYIDAYPSTFRNVRWFGNEMGKHLNITLPNNPLAAEMAQFEWALGLAFDAQDHPILTLNDLAPLAPEDWATLQLQAHPSLHHLHFNWNVLPVWQALNNAESAPDHIAINQHCIIWRQSFDSHFRSIDEAERQALQLTMSGINFGDLCEQLQATFGEEATQHAANYLATWINEGLLINTI